MRDALAMIVGDDPGQRSRRRQARRRQLNRLEGDRLLCRAAEETGAAASQVLSSAGELSRQSEHLGSEVSRFLATVRAA